MIDSYTRRIVGQMGLAPPGRNPGYAVYQAPFHHTPRSPVGKPAQSAPVALWRIFAHRPMIPAARHPNPGAKAAARLVSLRQGIIIIITYAAGKPAFVIDSYTRRIMDRMGFAPPGRNPGYGAYQSLFHDSLPADAALFNEFHALLDHRAKITCRKTRPLCAGCVLADLCPSADDSSGAAG